MPTKDEKLYIKGYRIYRVDEMQHGKGTAILVSNLVEADMDKIAEAIAMVIKGQESKVAEARAIVQSLTDKYPLI